MRTTTIDGSTVGWTDTATRPETENGTTTLLLHAGGFGAWFEPLARLLGGRVVNLFRAGYAGVPAVDPPVPIAGHAAHAAAILRLLQIPGCTVVAHSSGCVIALELALRHPEVVTRLVLSEPPLLAPLLDPSDAVEAGARLGPLLGAAAEAAAGGDPARALDLFLGAVCGPDHPVTIAAALGPGWRRRADRDAASFFAGELPALAAWSPGDLGRITTPTLLVQGDRSPQLTHRLISRLAAVLPGATTATIPGAGHLLPLTHPAELAALIEGPPARTAQTADAR